jgi:ribonuclease HI
MMMMMMMMMMMVMMMIRRRQRQRRRRTDSQWALNALKDSGHSAHSVLAPLRARLRGLKGRVCFQWVPAHFSLLGNKRADEEARKAANLDPADGAQRGGYPLRWLKA